MGGAGVHLALRGSDHSRYVGDRVRTTEQVALHVATSFAANSRQLSWRLHAFHRRGHVQAAAEARDGADDRLRFRVGLYVVDERPVDLDSIEREAPQVAERGVSRAEVVHRDAHAALSQFPQHRQRLIGVAHQDRFGDLQFQPLRLEPGIGERTMDLAHERALGKLHGRNVDGHADAGGPGRRIAAGLGQYPAADRDDQTRLLGQWDELHR
jgi:hypothetical protein